MIITYGEKGYLLSNILKSINIKCIDKNLLFFFSTPIDIKNDNDLNKYKNSQNLLNDAINLCKKYKLKMIYASTEAVLYESSLYKEYKLQDEKNIITNLEDFVIFRIPRVYSHDRNKGLIQNLRDKKIPLDDFSKQVEYITLNEFLIWFDKHYKDNGIINYNLSKHKNTIGQIKQIFML